MAFSGVGGIDASTTRYYNGERLLFMKMLFAAQPRCATRSCNAWWRGKPQLWRKLSAQLSACRVETRLDAFGGGHHKSRHELRRAKKQRFSSTGLCKRRA